MIKSGTSITDEIIFRAMDLIQRRSWDIKTIADLYKVDSAKLRLALNQKYGRENVEREILKAKECRSFMIGQGSAR